MSQSPSRLPQKIKGALSLFDSMILAYDRLHFWIDHPLPVIPSALAKDERVTIVRSAMQYGPKWQTKIELLQPDSDLLRACIDMVGERHLVLPNYVEIKLDFPVRSKSDAKRLQVLFLEHLLIKSFSYPVSMQEGTAYFKPPLTATGKPFPFNFVIYSDKPSKETDRPCCHLEWRLTGVSALESIGLISLVDFIDFDHRDFWSKRLDLFSSPSKAKLARWLDSRDENRSPTTRTNHADIFRQPYLHDRAFILQSCFVENRDIDELLVPVDNALFLPE